MVVILLLLDGVSIFVYHSCSSLIWLTVASLATHYRLSMSNSLPGVLMWHASRSTTMTHVAVIIARDLVLILHHNAALMMLMLLFVWVFDFHGS